MTASSGPQLCLAGGGSGGHVTPALALAEAIASECPGAHVHLACSRRSIDATVLSDTALPCTALPAQGLRRSPLGLIRFARAMYHARREARSMLEAQSIDAVALLGGYVAGSVLAAARQLNIPTLLLNLDAIPGRANRWMAPRATSIASTVPLARDLGRPGDCAVLSGPLIRERARPPAGIDQPRAKQQLDFDPDKPLLLVTGASQGATSLNQLMAHLIAVEPSLLHTWQVLHLAGPGRCADLQTQWASAGIHARVEAFRGDMGPAWAAADLLIARAGASTVAEARFAGVPAIYLPYPYHRDQHQRHNASPSVNARAACVVEDRIDPEATWPAFRDELHRILHTGALAHMRRAAGACKGLDGGPEAARALLALVAPTGELAGASPSGG